LGVNNPSTNGHPAISFLTGGQSNSMKRTGFFKNRGKYPGIDYFYTHAPTGPAAMSRSTPFTTALKPQNEGIFRIIPWFLSSNQET
jgi:hypothetical protein